MAMLFGLIFYIVTIMSLRFEVRGEMTADLVFSVLSDRFDQLTIETYSLKSELRSSVAAINDRIDTIEQISNSPLSSNTYNTEVKGKRNEMENPENKNPNNRILKALAAEKINVRNVLTDYEEQLIEFQRAVSDKMSVMNTTIEESRENMERRLEENTGNITKSVHKLMTHSEKRFQHVIEEFESAMINTSIELGTTRFDLNKIQNTVKDLEDDINGGWSSWSSWSKCSTRCGVGIRSQSRACNNPVPSLNGNNCIGDALRVDTCIFDPSCILSEYSDCSEIKLHEPNADDGVYGVVLWKTNRTILVYCDMTTDGGGWTVFQNRYDGSVDFYRNYSQYVQGFGDLHTEFWLGLDYIQEMSSQTVNELRIDLMAANGTTAYEVLTSFSLSPPGYVLNVGETTSSNNLHPYVKTVQLRMGEVGTKASDLAWTHEVARFFRFGPFHNGSAFSTYDHDVDSSSWNCASRFHGGWWYNDCTFANLNGQYLTPGTWDSSGMIYYSFNSYNSLKKIQISFRRV